MEQILVGLIEKYPMAASVIAVIVTVRYAVKAIEVAVDSFVASTPSEKDDLLVSGIKQKAWYKWIARILDWSVSIKLPKK